MSAQLDRKSAEQPAAVSHDTLSDVLRAVRLRGAVFFYVSGGREWAAESPESKELAPAVMPGAEHVMPYHVVTDGNCWAGIVGEPPCRLGTGDIVLFPHGDAHVLSSAPDMRAEPRVAWYYETKLEHLPIRIAYEGAGGPMPARPDQSGLTTVVCGFISCDVKPFNPLIAQLPRMLHLRAHAGGQWLTGVLQQAVAESNESRTGSDVMLARISEILFVDAVRRYVDQLCDDEKGWLSGIRDRFVGRALALLHQRSGDAWSIEALAREVGLSRSAMHERFVEFVGLSPMQYLANWRMQVASGLLRHSSANVATIALEVGYESEAAFSRAFKRLVGVPPAMWRKLNARAGPTGRA